MLEPEDYKVVRQCLEGQTDVFEKIVEKYQTPVYNAALRIVESRDDAEEITQTVFVRAFEKLEGYNPKFKFFSWLYRMAVNESLNFVSQKKQHEALSPMLVSKAKTPVESYQDKELSERIQEALMLLQVDYRVVIILRHFEGLTYEQMSYILDVPEKTVKSRLFTARHLLKDILSTRGVIDHD